MKDWCARFLATLELWRDTQRLGKTAMKEFSSALEMYAAAKNSWKHKRETLIQFGVDTSFLEVRLLETQEQAGELLRAEKDLCRLREFLKVFQACCDDMDQLQSCLAQVPGAQSVSAKVSECIQMYRTECEVKHSELIKPFRLSPVANLYS